MKVPLFYVFVFFAAIVVAQETDCDDYNLPLCCPDPAYYVPELPSPEELKCKDSKEALYAFLPKISTYKNYIFNKVNTCNKPSLDVYPGMLTMEYCIPKTRAKMIVELIDLGDPFFKTEAGKMNKDIYISNFDMGATAAFGNVTTNIKKFDANIVQSARFSPLGGSSNNVAYMGYHKDRYVIIINVDDPGEQYQRPEEFEAFIEDYVMQIHL